MIREHAFNTRWWGAPAGIVADAGFLTQPAAERARALTEWEWVEFVAHDASPDERRALAASGFVHADTQVQFRLDLRPHRDAPLPSGFSVRSGGEIAAVDLSTAQPFTHERFTLLAGITAELLAARYTLWAAELHAANPDQVLQFEAGDRPGGWFFARPTSGPLELTLAVAAQGGLSGLSLYRSAFGVFARAGHRLGTAGFSARNLAVLNVYAALGARFTGAREVWLWQRTS